MDKQKTPTKLSRAEIAQALDTVPVSHILGRSATRELTPKQRRFALEVAKGSTKATAYRTAYNTSGSKRNTGTEGSHLSKSPRIAAEIEAYRLALEAAEYRSPAALRALVVQSLVQVVIDPDAKQSVKVAAAKVLGTVTEVAAFTERKEVRTIDASSAARDALLQHLKGIMAERVVGSGSVDSAADELLAELAGAPGGEPVDQPGGEPGENGAWDQGDGEDATPPAPTPPTPNRESRG